LILPPLDLVYTFGNRSGFAAEGLMRSASRPFIDGERANSQ
jgi:hypothetical protein